MKRNDWIGALLFALILLALCLLPAHCENGQPKQAYVVCAGRCLESVKFGEHAELVTPMRDGKPDYSKSMLRGTIVNYNPTLEKVEMR